MSERQRQSPETELSPEQLGLIASARALLTLGQVQTSERTEYRETTRREKVAVVLGKITGRDRRPIISSMPSTDRFTEAPKTIQITKTKRVRWDRWAHAEGAWYVEVESKKDVDTGAVTARLAMYRVIAYSAAWGGPNGYDEKSRVEETYELLEPINDQDKVASMRAMLDAALVYERLQSLPE